MRLWLWLIDLLKCKKDIYKLLVFKVIHVLSGIIFALWMKKTIDDIYISSNMFIYNACIFTFIILLQVLVSAIVYYLTNHLELSIDHKLKSKMLTAILNKDYQELSDYHSGELMNRYSSDLSKLAGAIAKQLPGLLTMIIRIIIVMIVISFISPLLSIILCIGGILTVFFAFVVKKILKPVTQRVNQADDQLKSQVQECIESLLVIHSFHSEQAIFKVNQDHLNEYINAQTKRIHLMNIFETALSLAIQCAYIIGFLYAVYGVMNNQLSVGSISAIISLVGQIKNPFVGISMALPQLIVLGTHIERIQHLIADEAIRCKENARDYYHQLKTITLENIHFSYEDKIIFDDFNLQIKKGETLALVGYSGVGKTTLLKLLMNIYPLNKGKIYLELEDQSIDISNLGYGLMTYVPQDYGLMSGTIREAVAFGCEHIDDKKVQWACEKACIHNDIIKLRDGYHTVLKEQGKSMSGGQMQRLSIARAIYSECPIMLLDEVTSSLHPSLEQDIIQSLKSLENKTIIIVTHRKEILNICDRIIDFDEVNI